MDFSKKLFYEILVEREGFSFPVEVVYEWILEFFTHCQNLGHNLTSCRWLYPQKENKEPHVNVDKGRSKVISKKQEWVPLRVNTSGICSFNAFVALTETQAHVVDTVKDVAANSFRFALQNVTNEVP